MKSQFKVKQQRRIRQILNYCDNPTGREANKLNELVRKGVIVITKPQPRKTDKTSIRRMNRSTI